MSHFRPLPMVRQSSDKRPPIPPGGIHRQRTPGFLRVLLKVLVLPFMKLDLLIQALFFRWAATPYHIEGGCKQLGNCCHYILFAWPEMIKSVPWLGHFWMWWYTDVHGFYERGFDLENEQGEVAKVMSCRYLQPDGRCGQHPLRPSICRQWPRTPYGVLPSVLKGCGYQIVVDDPSRVTGLKETSEKTSEKLSETDENS